jgi:plasmid stabilization system protein ParE
MNEIKTMDLEVELTASERQEAAEQLSARIDEKLQIMAQHKEQKAAMKRKEDALEDEIKRLAKAHKTGKELRAVPIDERQDIRRGVVEVYRMDTDELVTRRPLSEDERNRIRQGTIPGVQ